MKAPERIRIAVYGLGQIGLETVKAILSRPALQLVGAIDHDPAKQQRDVADLSGLKRPSGVRVSDRADDVLGVSRPDVVILTTGSRFKQVLPQIKQCVEARTNVVSSCEELLMPHVNYAAQARELNKLAVSRDVSVLGTGVNPGFVMDTFALAATAPCVDLTSIRIERVVDASTRRENLQKKVGAGPHPLEVSPGPSTRGSSDTWAFSNRPISWLRGSAGISTKSKRRSTRCCRKSA